MNCMFVVTEDRWEDDGGGEEIKGVFTTLELAEAYIGGKPKTEWDRGAWHIYPCAIDMAFGQRCWMDIELDSKSDLEWWHKGGKDKKPE